MREQHDPEEEERKAHDGRVERGAHPPFALQRHEAEDAQHPHEGNQADGVAERAVLDTGDPSDLIEGNGGEQVDDEPGTQIPGAKRVGVGHRHSVHRDRPREPLHDVEREEQRDQERHNAEKAAVGPEDEIDGDGDRDHDRCREHQHVPGGDAELVTATHHGRREAVIG